MSLSKSRKEIEKELIVGNNVKWEYLLDLRRRDKETRTNDYISAKNVLKDRGKFRLPISFINNSEI